MFSFKCWLCHKKRRDSLKGSLDWVLFLTELELPKILVSRLPQYNLNVKIEDARKSEWLKQLCYLCVTSFLEHWHTLLSFILILVCFSLVMPPENYVIYGSSSAKTTPGVSLYWSLILMQFLIPAPHASCETTKSGFIQVLHQCSI